MDVPEDWFWDNRRSRPSMPPIAMSAATGTPDALVDQIDLRLPQTQCTRCGYPTCRAYATAIAAGAAGIEHCPPGGVATLEALAALLGRPLAPEAPHAALAVRQRAEIDETRCIGCRKCVDACPIDAIVGARKWMHTVIAAECSGCALCLPPCPVDCIALVPAPATPDPESLWPEYRRAETERWRVRAAARLVRLGRKEARRSRATPAGHPTERERIRAEIRAAVERARARKRT
jgi:electron transport complex protein RnfB